MAVERLRARVPDAEIGVVLNFNPMHPASDDSADIAAASAKDALHNRWYAEPIAGLGYPIDATGADRWSAAELRDGDLDVIAAPIDVLGVNYYSRALVNAADDRIDPPGPVTGMGWRSIPRVSARRCAGCTSAAASRVT